MDLRALRYFVEVVRCQSFTVAAEHLFVGQSAVSKLVRNLEEDVGVPLLIRDEGQRKRRVILTDAGQIVLTYAQHMLASERALMEELSSLGNLQQGSLSIGIPPLGATILAAAISEFHKRWPKIELKLLESGSLVVEAAVRAAELEFGVFLAPIADDLSCISVCNYPLYLLHHGYHAGKT